MATKVIAWNTGSGNITLTYQGQGNGPITVQSDDNDIGTARSQVITVETVGGAVVQNLTISQGACPFPVGDVKNYAYTGAKQTVILPAGTYKLQCWGAQGGSNGTNSTYGITAKAGGKGGYSEGVLTLSTPTEVEINVGGQGSATSGGFNGGGSTTGTSSYSTGTSGQDGYEFGYSKMGGGGGATDIRLKDGGFLSRFIVAGGGSGGAMCCRKKTTSTSTTVTDLTYTDTAWSGPWGTGTTWSTGTGHLVSLRAGVKYTISATGTDVHEVYFQLDSSPWTTYQNTYTPSSNVTVRAVVNTRTQGATVTCYVKHTETSTSTSTSNDSQVGYAGGGTTGVAYSSTYQGKQNAAGSGGSFGQGANQATTGYRYCSGAGGGGWYGGGGGQKSDSSMTYCKYSGGGSGWVNIAANAGNRPSGYTGLELDSGTTYAGDTSFPNTAGTGNETGHSGNGYAKITRLS